MNLLTHERSDTSDTASPTTVRRSVSTVPRSNVNYEARSHHRRRENDFSSVTGSNNEGLIGQIRSSAVLSSRSRVPLNEHGVDFIAVFPDPVPSNVSRNINGNVNTCQSREIDNAEPTVDIIFDN